MVRLMNRKSTLCLIALLMGGCEDPVNHNPTTDGGAGTTDGLAADGGAGMLRIYVQGDKRPTTFADKLSGQTPRDYKMGLAHFELLRSANDPSPLTVFDHKDTAVMVDMLKRNLVGQAELAKLTPGTYTHGRVLLTWCEFTVAATVHAAGLALPGDIQVKAALSDTTHQGKAWKQGQATFTFKAGTLQQTAPGLLPPLPSTGGGAVVQQGGKTYMVFTYPAPIIIAPSANKSYTGTMVYKVFESFRWQDETKLNYKAKVFDVDGLGLTYEPVKGFGATGYGVELN